MLRLSLADINETVRIYEDDLTGMRVPKVNVASKAIFNESLSSDPCADTYSVRTKSGDKMIMVSDSCHEGLNEVLCWWCSHSYPVTENVGIIVALGADEGVFSATTTGYTCSEECSIAYAIEQKKKGRNAPSKFMASDLYHRTVHNVLYPRDGPLVPAKDPNLLKSRGGSLTREQWLDRRHIYVENPYMIISRAKTTYLKTSLR